MKQNKKTGGVRLKQLIDSGKIPFKGGIFLDTYNQTVSDIAGTIQVGIDYRHLHYVTQVIENG